MTDPVVLAVDLGTGGPKVALVTARGEVVWQDFVPVSTRLVDGGGAEQDPADWWEAVTSRTRAAMASGAVRPEQVVAVSCTGQWASTVPVDAAGEPVGPCIMWMDQRGGPHAKRVVGGPVQGYHPRKLVTWLRKSGGVPSPTGNDPVGQRLFLRAERPEVHHRAACFLEPVDYLNLRFTGVAAASPASMTAAWLVDTRDPASAGYDDALVRLSTLDPAQLPRLLATGAVVGTVLPAVADDLGLPPGVRVVTGTPDLHSAPFGAGAIGDYEAHVAISSTSWLSCHVPWKRSDPIRQVTTVPGAVPGRWLVADNHETAGLCLQWLRSNVVLAEDGLTDPGGDTGYAAFDRVAATVPPGSGGVVFTPWLAGERTPVADPTIRGAFLNLSLSTTRADLVRAVLEGVAYNNRWLLDVVERFVRRPLTPLRFIGGGSASDVWCRIHADVLGRTVEQVADPFVANVRGAALFAAVSLGYVQAHEVRGLVPVAGRYEPDPATKATYDRLYAEYPGLYRRLKGVHRRWNGVKNR